MWECVFDCLHKIIFSPLTYQTWEITKSNSVINLDYPVIVILFHLTICWLKVEHEYSSGLRNVKGKSIVGFQEKVSFLLRTHQKNSLFTLLDLLLFAFDGELLHLPFRSEGSQLENRARRPARYIPGETQKEPRSLQTLLNH